MDSQLDTLMVAVERVKSFSIKLADPLITLDCILATSAMVIGGLAIARALDDPNLSEQVLENCRVEALRLLNG